MSRIKSSLYIRRALGALALGGVAVGGLHALARGAAAGFAGGLQVEDYGLIGIFRAD